MEALAAEFAKLDAQAGLEDPTSQTTTIDPQVILA